ncbi:acyltransferase family protein [Vibrio sp. 10N.286.49.E11]|uniref:acyltransferase family protein n=1 Tax=Vibrio sp. 10N.286.49.E11 TaxID=3229703 RepID=UPI003552C7B3
MNVNIQGLRGMAVLLVLFTHMFRVEENYYSDTVIPDFVLSGFVGVDIFFIISGFIMYITTVNIDKRDTFFNMVDFLRKRAVRIYPPYWVFSIILLVFAAFFPNMVFSGAEYSLWSSLLLIPDLNQPILAVGWTLIHEMYFYLVFSFFLLFSRGSLNLLLFLWGSLVLVLDWYLVDKGSFLTLALSPLTIEFIIGVYIGSAYFSFKDKFSKINPALVYTYVVAFPFIVYFLYEAYYIHAPGHLSRTLLFSLPCSLLVLSLLVFESKKKFVPNVFVMIGNSSYSIYLSHVLVINVIAKIFFFLSLDIGAVENYALVFTMFFASVIFGYISYLVLEVKLGHKLNKLTDISSLSRLSR